MYEYKARLDRVVDGDTMDVVIDLGFRITTHQRLRLADINTPEIYRVSRESEEYRRGMQAKRFVEQRLAENNNEMIVETSKTGKYGRYIAVVRLADSDVSLNQALIQAGLAEALR